MFLAIGSTDMRKGINGLSLVVADRLSLDPFSGHLFRWPQSGEEVAELSSRELGWLPDGLDPIRVKGHSDLQYSTII